MKTDWYSDSTETTTERKNKRTRQRLDQTCYNIFQKSLYDQEYLRLSIFVPYKSLVKVSAHCGQGAVRRKRPSDAFHAFYMKYQKVVAMVRAPTVRSNHVDRCSLVL